MPKKYGRNASKDVAREMDKFKHGNLKSAKSWPRRHSEKPQAGDRHRIPSYWGNPEDG